MVHFSFSAVFWAFSSGAVGFFFLHHIYVPSVSLEIILRGLLDRDAVQSENYPIYCCYCRRVAAVSVIIVVTVAVVVVVIVVAPFPLLTLYVLNSTLTIVDTTEKAVLQIDSKSNKIERQPFVSESTNWINVEQDKA